MQRCLSCLLSSPLLAPSLLLTLPRAQGRGLHVLPVPSAEAGSVQSYNNLWERVAGCHGILAFPGDVIDSQLLKEAGKATSTSAVRQYDLVYCAGLFDYVSDRVCRRLNELFYHLLAPGGLMVVTNVDASKPFRHSMDFLLEWHLIYRDRAAMERLVPAQAQPGSATVTADPTGVNLFLEIRKPATP